MNEKDLREITELIRTEKQFSYALNCRRCGACTSTWPSLQRCALSTYAVGSQINAKGLNSVIEDIVQGESEFTPEIADFIFRCVTCDNCIYNCGMDTMPRHNIFELRKALIERGIAPKTFSDTFKAVEENGNVWNEAQGDRAKWAEGLDVKMAAEGGFEYLLFVGDSDSYVPRNQETARNLIKILKAASVSFAILGEEEISAGDEILTMGEAGMFEYLAEENISRFKAYNVKKIITISPHDYNALKNEYPKLVEDWDIEVVHYTTLLASLIKSGALSLTKPVNLTVTYQDPCYLGRHNDIVEEPRAILAAISGVTLIEMPANEKSAGCCGGGGGGIFMSRGEGNVIETRRLEEAADTGADVLVTACPLCMQMFDGANDSFQEKRIEVRDIIDLVAEAL